jgi:hypothetical protein
MGALLHVQPGSTKLYNWRKAHYCTYKPTGQSCTTGSGRTVARTTQQNKAVLLAMGPLLHVWPGMGHQQHPAVQRWITGSGRTIARMTQQCKAVLLALGALLHA